MTKYTIEEFKTLMELGFTKDDIVKMSTETVATVGSKTTKTTKTKTTVEFIRICLSIGSFFAINKSGKP